MTAISPESPLLAGRRAAIEASGVGIPFRFFQLRNACFWVFVWGMVAGTFQLTQFYGGTAQAFGVALGSGAILFGIYTVPWLLLLAHHNRYTSLPPKALLTCFVWGFVPAVFWLGLQANTALLGIYDKVFGHAWMKDWGGGLAAPLTEETAKALAVVLMIGLAPHLVRSAYDGLILGAFAGLGLQISEDLLYVFNGANANFGSDQVKTAFTVFTSRGGAGLFQHVLFSAVFCAGLVWLLGREPGHRLRGLFLILGAVIVHSCWDNLGTYGRVIGGDAGVVLGLPLLAVVCLLLLWLTFRLAAPQERAWIKAILEPEVDDHVLTQQEVDAIAGDRRARTRYVKAAPHRRPAKHVLEAGLDLSRMLAESRGEETEPVLLARAEVSRVRSAGPLGELHVGAFLS